MSYNNFNLNAYTLTDQNVLNTILLYHEYFFLILV
jgi:hypothetical protein